MGGVQTVLRRHLRQDSGLGISSSAVLWFEKGPFESQAAGRPADGLGLKWWNSGRTLRRRLRGLLRRPPAAPSAGDHEAFWAYHDLWGLTAAADLDGAGRRVGIVHSQWEATDGLLQASPGLVDGMLCISAATVDLARSRLPALEAERIAWLPVPVDPPERIPEERPAGRSERVIGYCGRIQKHQKRVERIPGVARALRTAGVPHRWEFLGTGSEAAALEAGLASAGVAARFHGMRSGEDYWRILAGWDAIVFTSDFEGLPIAMIEAMCCGVIPVFPDVPCGGRDYTARVAPGLVYAAGDPAAAAQTLRWLFDSDAAAIEAFRTRAREAAGAHARDAYGRTFAAHVEHLSSLPRISSAGAQARRPHLGEWFPFALLARLNPDHPLRRGYL
ncbi:MAG: glycosyltransferase family 4 protein [Verrucomicrobiae bacterium]|nr:glycosyltransferase family 4 protein [Verrucomicrobiae bacterium]